MGRWQRGLGIASRGLGHRIRRRREGSGPSSHAGVVGRDDTYFQRTPKALNRTPVSVLSPSSTRRAWPAGCPAKPFSCVTRIGCRLRPQVASLCRLTPSIPVLRCHGAHDGPTFHPPAGRICRLCPGETMPIFEYRCSACGHLEEVLQKHTDPAPAECPRCHAAQTMAKELSLSAFHLKGGGWYKDLYSSSSSSSSDSGSAGASGGSTAAPAAATAAAPATGTPASAPAAAASPAAPTSAPATPAKPSSSAA